MITFSDISLIFQDLGHNNKIPRGYGSLLIPQWIPKEPEMEVLISLMRPAVRVRGVKYRELARRNHQVIQRAVVSNPASRIVYDTEVLLRARYLALRLRAYSLRDAQEHHERVQHEIVIMVLRGVRILLQNYSEMSGDERDIIRSSLIHP